MTVREEILWLPIAYEVEIGKPGDESGVVKRVWESMPIPVKVAQGPMEPAVTVSWKMGRLVTWVENDGALWRPFIGEGLVTGRSEDFQRELAELVKSGHAWDDYPFRHESGDKMQFGDYPKCLERSVALPKKATVLADGRDKALAAALDEASRNLLLVDGVPHRRSVGPVWTIGSPRNPLFSGYNVRMAAPENDFYSLGLSIFPYDRVEEAMNFAERLETMARNPTRLAVAVDATVEIHRPAPALPPSLSVSSAWTGIKISMEKLTFERVPGPILSLLGRLEDTVTSLEASPFDRDLVEVADGLIERLADHPFVSSSRGSLTYIKTLREVRAMYLPEVAELDADDAYALGLPTP